MVTQDNDAGRNELVRKFGLDNYKELTDEELAAGVEAVDAALEAGEWDGHDPLNADGWMRGVSRNAKLELKERGVALKHG